MKTMKPDSRMDTALDTSVNAITKWIAEQRGSHPKRFYSLLGLATVLVAFGIDVQVDKYSYNQHLEWLRQNTRPEAAVIMEANCHTGFIAYGRGMTIADYKTINPVQFDDRRPINAAETQYFNDPQYDNTEDFPHVSLTDFQYYAGYGIISNRHGYEGHVERTPDSFNMTIGVKDQPLSQRIEFSGHPTAREGQQGVMIDSCRVINSQDEE